MTTERQHHQEPRSGATAKPTNHTTLKPYSEWLSDRSDDRARDQRYRPRFGGTFMPLLQEGLFGQVGAVTAPVRQVELHNDIQWRPVGSIRTSCGHCQMLRHRDKEAEVHPARWARTDQAGAVLHLCTGHREQQEARDADAAERETGWRYVVDSIVATMQNPDDLDAEQLGVHVLHMGQQLDDIRRTLYIDMDE